MDHGPVLALLVWRQLGPRVRADRHDVGGAVGEHHAGAGERHLHHVLGEVARGVRHRLVRGGDVAGGRVVVGPEVRAAAAAARAAATSAGSATAPRASKIDCVVSTMSSIGSEPAGEARLLLERRERLDQRRDLARAS